MNVTNLEVDERELTMNDWKHIMRYFGLFIENFSKETYYDLKETEKVEAEILIIKDPFLPRNLAQNLTRKDFGNIKREFVKADTLIKLGRIHEIFK